MKKLFLIIPLFLSLISFSQEKWTVEKCIKHAIDNNLQIKSQLQNNQITENNLLQSKLDLLPSLNVGANESIILGRSVDPYTNEFSSENYNSTNFQLSSSITLFNGLQNYNQIKKSKIEKEKAEYQLEIVKKNMILTIISAYLNILYTSDLVELSRQQRDITKQQLDRILLLVNADKLPQQNKYEMEAQLANEELNILIYENQLSAANLVLVQLLELENYENFQILKPEITEIPAFETLTVEQIYEEALKNMPEIKYAEMNIESSAKNLSIARGGLYPRLTFNASYGTGYSSARQMIDHIIIGNTAMPTGAFVTDLGGNRFDVYQNVTNIRYKKQSFDFQIKDNASTSFSFNLSIPLFNGYTARTQVQNSKIYLEQSKISIEQTKKDLLKEIQQANSDAVAASKKYIATHKTMESNLLSFQYTEARYQQGLLNSTDYNVAKNNLTKVEVELLKAKYDFIFKIKILNFYLGKDINL